MSIGELNCTHAKARKTTKSCGLCSDDIPCRRACGSLRRACEPCRSACGALRRACEARRRAYGSLRRAYESCRHACGPRRHAYEPRRHAYGPCRHACGGLRHACEPCRDACGPLRRADEPRRPPCGPCRHANRALRQTEVAFRQTKTHPVSPGCVSVCSNLIRLECVGLFRRLRIRFRRARANVDSLVLAGL